MCGKPLPEPSGPGRPARYCSAAHRQKAYQDRIRANAVGQEILAAQSEVEKHLAQAAQGVTAMADSTRWAESAAAIAASHKKALDALSPRVVGELGVSKLERALMADVRAAEAVVSLSAVDEAAMRTVEAERAMAANVTRSLEAERAMAADATRAFEPERAAAALGSHVTGLAAAMHRPFSDTTHALSAYMNETELLSKTQFAETANRLASASDLLDVARSAAGTVTAARLTQGFATDIGRLARHVDDLDVEDRSGNSESLDEIEDDPNLSAIIGPSLNVADPALLLVLVAVTVYPSLFGTATTHLIQALQDTLFWLRMLGRLTTVDDAIPGVLLLATLYGLSRK